jgi:hypothetical protein
MPHAQMRLACLLTALACAASGPPSATPQPSPPQPQRGAPLLLRALQDPAIVFAVAASPSPLLAPSPSATPSASASPSPDPALARFLACEQAQPTTLPSRLIFGTGHAPVSAGGASLAARISPSGIVIGKPPGLLAVCALSVEQVSLSSWRVQGVGLGFNATLPAGEVCVIVQSRPSFAVSVAFDAAAPWRCPQTTSDGDVVTGAGVSEIVIEGVVLDAGSVLEVAAAALFCVGASLLFVGFSG